MVIQDWVQVVVGSLQNLWLGAVGVLGSVIGALIVLILGLIVASGLAAVVEGLIRVIKLDSLLERLGVEEYVERAGLELNSPRFFGRLVYWFFVVVFLLAASDILRFYTLSEFLQKVLVYIPNIVVAVLIMLAALVVAHFLRALVRSSIKSARLHASVFLSSITWWSVVIFGFFAALSQLGVAVSIINSLVAGFVAMIAIAGGIAFGLGGKGVAQEILEKLREHVEE